MTDDLRKRLRAKVDVGSSLLDGLPVNPDGPEAADRIEALTAEKKRLRAALEKMQRGRDRYRQAWEAEKTRLVEALELNMEYGDKFARDKARVALGDTQ